MSRRTSRPSIHSLCDRYGTRKHRVLCTYKDIVAAYIRDKRSIAARELGSYAVLPSLRIAVQFAALSQDPVFRKRHPHQTRIPQKTLVQARDRLLRADMEGCRSFHELFVTVHNAIGSIHGIGDLTVYDIATRIGAYLRLEPNRVYLHAGTRVGASSVLLVRGRAWFSLDELPDAFAKLKPREIEDCFCIFKDALRAIDNQKTGMGYEVGRNSEA